MRFNAEIKFPSRTMAQDFARAWSRHTLKGHILGATKPDGETTVIAPLVSEPEKVWIADYVAKLNNA